jgi:putative phosphoribosyl transferase
MVFNDRREAGERLAKRLLTLKGQAVVVLALPRGGVPVALEVARALAAPLDLVLVRKIGAPHQEELAIGAIAEGEPPELVTDPEAIGYLAVPAAYLERAKAVALEEIARRRRAYLGERPPMDIAGRTAIIIDDGIATGATTLAAVRATRTRKPARLVLAVPIASRDAVKRLRPEVDELVCLDAPAEFYAVGQFYRDFPQLSDEEVIGLLAEAHTIARPQQA